MPNQNEIELRKYLDVIRYGYALILGCVLLAAITAFSIAFLMPPLYDATTTLLVEPSKDTIFNEYNVLMAGERLALTYSKMLKGQPVLEAVIAQLGLTETPDELAERITTETIQNTQLLRLTASDSSPIKAALLANTVAEKFTNHLQTLQAQRYTTSLESIQEKIDSLSVGMEETQSKITDLSTNKIEAEADLARLDRLQGEYRNDYRSLEQEYQVLQLTIAQLNDYVNIVEAAHVPESTQEPPYSATMMLILANELSTDTYGHMLSGRSVLEAAIAMLGLYETPEALENRIVVEMVPNTQLIRLIVLDNDASQAILLADAIAHAFISQNQTLLAEPYTDRLASLQTEMNELSTRMEQTQADIELQTATMIQADTELAQLESLFSENRSDYRTLQQDYEQLRLTAADATEAVVIAEPAQPPEKPVPRILLFTTLGAAVGLVVGLGLAYLLEYLDDTIKTPQDVNKSLGVNALGTIPQVNNGEEEVFASTQPRSPIAEAFRMLVTNLRFYSVDKPLRTLLVSSPGPDEGKSFIVANLAVTMAASGLRIVIVDADLRRPRLHGLFNLDAGDGLTSSLLEGNVDGKLQPSEVEGLSILTSGEELPPNPIEILSSQTMQGLLEQLTTQADLVLMDSPPVLSVADTSVVASYVDGILLVLDAGRTRPAAAQQALDSLHHVGANLVGVVLNGVPVRAGNYNYYYQEYHSHAKSRRGKLSARLKAFLLTIRNRFQRNK
jgi:succinoglycan biosynthesis transport protein ExoP